MARLFNKLPRFLQSKWAIGIIVLLVMGGGYRLLKGGGTAYQLVSVTRGSITETVSITGNTTPMQGVSLGFQNTGTISRVYRNLGDTVKAGQVIAQLNVANLYAALQQAQATVAIQQARLDGLKAGSQPQDIAASQAALQKAQQDLANLYSNISDAAASGYTKANDAVRTQLDGLFYSPEGNIPQLTFTTSDSNASYAATSLRLSASTELNKWQTELIGVTSLSSPEILSPLLKSGLAHLAVVRNLLNAVSATLDGNVNLTSAQLATYKANVTVALTEVNAAISSLNTISQSISSQQATVAQVQAQLALKQAGSSSHDIAAQQAQVEQARAGVASAFANLQGAQIIAPISGVITQLDAKVGQLATPGTPLVSIIGNGGFEVDAGVSETDIGKLADADAVSMTLDAFPGETFAGSVFYIAPAQTNTQGVITYLVKVSFNQLDPRLKSGLTANVDIQTQHKDDVLILPQYAIVQNDKGAFVKILENNTAKEMPVTLGIQDQKGNVEIVSGVTEGEQVINIGLKTQ
ncbi:MAG: hypothetical protein A3A33_03115 [Candidatus Yanofskybacteria bacterium RIFCSPLOWO2_01_FULL_49_25]|uniref:Uncharacterized protein n=1 Tax=Candidatus Yanofskybacteria bacterium RIFCSPLOWO2_01_FULL_49_25 TaxID=1802701 RepID=A0A1F8GVQ9_9BACT|nr:MAG: hypothetical protein A3A33_03115 [Candidatus Yanofskybacteria bacterium RIFCSPLOWO2_01_FULL_49_25]